VLERSLEIAVARLPVVLLLTALIGCSSEPDEPPPREKTLAEQYPGRWRTDIRGDISGALARHHARGCGVYVHRTHYLSESDFLVYCSPDGQSSWTAFLVWPNIDEVMGPSRIEPTLPPPAL
jgi:hypothetical protein